MVMDDYLSAEPMLIAFSELGREELVVSKGDPLMTRPVTDIGTCTLDVVTSVFCSDVCSYRPLANTSCLPGLSLLATLPPLGYTQC